MWKCFWKLRCFGRLLYVSTCPAHVEQLPAFVCFWYSAVPNCEWKVLLIGVYFLSKLLTCSKLRKCGICYVASLVSIKSSMYPDPFIWIRAINRHLFTSWKWQGTLVWLCTFQYSKHLDFRGDKFGMELKVLLKLLVIHWMLMVLVWTMRYLELCSVDFELWRMFNKGNDLW